MVLISRAHQRTLPDALAVPAQQRIMHPFTHSMPQLSTCSLGPLESNVTLKHEAN